MFGISRGDFDVFGVSVANKLIYYLQPQLNFPTRWSTKLSPFTCTMKMLMEIFQWNESEKLLHKVTKLMVKLPAFLHRLFSPAFSKKTRYNYNSFIFLLTKEKLSIKLNISLALKDFLCISNFSKLLLFSSLSHCISNSYFPWLTEATTKKKESRKFLSSKLSIYESGKHSLSWGWNCL